MNKIFFGSLEKLGKTTRPQKGQLSKVGTLQISVWSSPVRGGKTATHFCVVGDEDRPTPATEWKRIPSASEIPALTEHPFQDGGWVLVDVLPCSWSEAETEDMIGLYPVVWHRTANKQVIIGSVQDAFPVLFEEGGVRVVSPFSEQQAEDLVYHPCVEEWKDAGLSDVIDDIWWGYKRLRK